MLLGRALAQLDDTLDKLESMFLRRQPFLCGDDITVADLLAVCELMQVRGSDGVTAGFRLQISDGPCLRSLRPAAVMCCCSVPSCSAGGTESRQLSATPSIGLTPSSTPSETAAEPNCDIITVCLEHVCGAGQSSAEAMNQRESVGRCFSLFQ